MILAGRAGAQGLGFPAAAATDSAALAQAMPALAAQLIRALGINPRIVEGGVDGALRRQLGQSTIAPDAALALVRAYHTRQVFRALVPLAAAIVADDDRRRYAIDKQVPVRTPDGATICTMIVRPRSAPPLPTMLNFTIYADTVAKLIEARAAGSP